MARTIWDWSAEQLRAGILDIQTQLTELTGEDWIGRELYVPEPVDDTLDVEMEDVTAEGEAIAPDQTVLGFKVPKAETLDDDNNDMKMVKEARNAIQDEDEVDGEISPEDFDAVDSMFEGESGEINPDYQRAKLIAAIEKVKARLRRLGVEMPDEPYPGMPKKRGRPSKGLTAKRWRESENLDGRPAKRTKRS